MVFYIFLSKNIRRHSNQIKKYIIVSIKVNNRHSFDQKNNNNRYCEKSNISILIVLNILTNSFTQKKNILTNSLLISTKKKG